MKNIGFALCGSFCTFKEVFEEIEFLKAEGYNIVPIMSDNSYSLDTRFGKAADWRSLFIEITGNEIIHTIPQAEPIGPKKLLDALIIAPCTGNTLAKLATGVTDTAVTLAAKAHLRNARPLIIAPSTNDALANASKNIGMLLNYKNIYFVPFSQDSYRTKPLSMVANFPLIKNTLECALEGEQIQPIVMSPR
ncbi:MAG: dipicolinate synthase subunit B [Clostridia bacterium]|jgi:dipicolinate synthase subunit B|nr:dipicolinate synthase subunit B [Clostridia bacterium]